MPALCPPPEDLSSLLTGNLPPERFEELMLHLDGCEACQDAAQSSGLVVDPWVESLSDSSSPDAHEEEPECESAVSRAESLSSSAGLSAASSHGEQLEFEALGPYQILELLGAGGMGQVYKARHTKLDRIVAVKVLPAERLRSPPALTRFEREMKAVGQLDHPNIVRATDAGEHEGVHFLVMDYLAGVDLSQLVRQLGPLPVPEACELVRQAAVGLAHAHQQGLVHRDIKPSNLMLAPGAHAVSSPMPSPCAGSAQAPTVKVLDMGLALLREDGAGDPGPTVLSQSGVVLGTLDYMAPEQLDSPHTVDIGVDVYGLGATLYKLLTGGAPFSGEKYESRLKKLAAMATEDPPSASSYRGDLPSGLVSAIDRMLARDPADRFAAPADVAQALAPFAEVADLPALWERVESASVPSPVTQPPIRPSQRPSSLRRGAAVARIAGALLLVGLLAFWAVRHFQRFRTETPAPAPRPAPAAGQPVAPTEPTPTPALAAAPFDEQQARALQSAWAEYLDVAVEHENTVGMKLRLIPPGDFMMGGTREEIDQAIQRDSRPGPVGCCWTEDPQHFVRLTKTFYLGCCEVTQRQYEEVMGNNPSEHWDTVDDGADHPVQQVTWFDAVDFCNRLSTREGLAPYYRRAGSTVTILGGEGYRLPTEAEWEFACRAGTQTRWYFGDDERDLDRQARFGLDSSEGTAAVGQKLPNPFGLHDLYGNVAEWCQDHFAGYGLRLTVTDPIARPSEHGRVVRGGQYCSLGERVRSASRGKTPPTRRTLATGFRVARTPAQPAGLVPPAAPPAGPQMIELPNGWRIGAAQNLGSTVNSPQYERSPSLTADGLTLVFGSFRPSFLPGGSYWTCTRASVGQPWSPPTRIALAEREPAGTISADGLTLVFTSNRPGGMGGWDLWTATRLALDRPFGEPSNLGASVNSSETDCAPRLSEDGLALLFESRRPGGEGGDDIWQSTRKSLDQPWEQPINLGPLVNSPHKEGGGHLSPDGLALFLSSNRPGTRIRQRRRTDLWMCTRPTVDEPWGEAVNLGTLVNTEYFESAAVLSAPDGALYFYSERPDGCGDTDLWMAPILPPDSPAKPPDPPDPAALGLSVHEPGWTLTQTVRHGRGLTAAAFHPVSGWLYFGTQRGWVKWLHRVNPDGSTRSLYPAAGIGFAFSPKGRQLLVTNTDRLVTQIDSRTSRPTRAQDLTPNRVDHPAGIAFPPAGWTGRLLGQQQALCANRGHDGHPGLWRVSLDESPPEQIAVNADDLADPVDVAITQSEVYVIDRGRGDAVETSGAKEDALCRRIYRLDDDTLVPVRTDRPIVEPAGLAFDPATSDLLVLCRRSAADPEATTVLRIHHGAEGDRHRVTDVLSGFSTPALCGIDISADGQRIAVTDFGALTIYVFSREGDGERGE